MNDAAKQQLLAAVAEAQRRGIPYPNLDGLSNEEAAEAVVKVLMDNNLLPVDDAIRRLIRETTQE